MDTRRRAYGWLVSLYYSCAMVVYFVSYPLRHLIYLLPAFTVLFNLLFLKKPGVDVRSFVPALIFSFLFTMPLLFSGSVGLLAMRDFVIIISPFVIFLFPVRITSRMVLTVYFSYVGCIVLSLFGFGRGVIRGILGQGEVASFMDSSGIAESLIAFPMGLFFIHFSARRKPLWSILAAAMMIITFKRSCILAALLALGFFFFLEILETLATARVRKGVTLTVVSALVLTSLAVGFTLRDTAALALDALDLGHVNIDYFIQGRTVLNDVMAYEIERSTLPEIMFGHGANESNLIIQKISFYLASPHNDVIRLIFDYGVVGFAGYIAAVWIFLARNNLGKAFFVNSMVLLPVTNSVMYLFYQFTAIYLVFSYSRSEEEQNDAREEPVS